MFINTKKEAKIAQKIAAAFGWERSIEYFYKKYTTNLFAGHTAETETRQMVSKINSAVKAAR